MDAAEMTDGEVEGSADGLGLLRMFFESDGLRELWFLAIVFFHLSCAAITVMVPAASVRASLFCLLCSIGVLGEHLPELRLKVCQ